MGIFSFLRRARACRLLDIPGGLASAKYAHFKELLEHNDRALDALAALEWSCHGGRPFTTGAARATALTMAEAVEGMAEALVKLSRGRHAGLPAVARAIAPRALAALDPPSWDSSGPLAASLQELSALAAREQEDGPWRRLAGGKAYNLARLKAGTALTVPDGFVVTSAAFSLFMTETGLDALAGRELEQASPLDLPGLEAGCARIRAAILSASLPGAVREALTRELEALGRRLGGERPLAVRSSAVGEDGELSFAGQYDSVLDVPFDQAGEALKRVFAGKYSPRAVLYRLRHGLDDTDAPMAALALAMVRSEASGVLYTLDLAGGAQGEAMRLEAVAGLGDGLVSGRAAPSSAVISREDFSVTGLAPGAPLSEAQAGTAGRAGMEIERLFGQPQDVEWCFEGGRLFVVQARPLDVTDVSATFSPPAPELPGLRTLAEGGVTASPGAACGPVLRVEGSSPAEVPDGAIVVAATAAPELAALLDRAGGVVTAQGAVACHLASVAREMGVPALFGVADCMRSLAPGMEVTLDASGGRVFEGRAEALIEASVRSARATRADSPMRRRLRSALELLSPLTLTDPRQPSFSAEGCRTLHDVTRFAHETGMREMFGLAGYAGDDQAPAVRLKAAIPLTLYCMDLGGGLREGLTDCDTARPTDIVSAPMRAIWQGFTHPGITWAGTVAFDPRSFLTLMASAATAEVDGGQPGGDSYALLGRDYMNLSARFGYHFANVDAFVGEQPSRNHVTLRFGGGAGGIAGKNLRVAFLSAVLSRLGFSTEPSGGALDASLKGVDAKAALHALDMLGRLLATSRLLDMAIAGVDEALAMADAFLAGDYDLLARRPQSPLPGFHLTEGEWRRTEEDGRALARQDGSAWATGLSRGLAGLFGRLYGARYQKFLDSVGAYFHFPLAVAKDSHMGDGRACVKVRPVSGSIDRAAGLAFAVRTAGTYLVFRINALEDNAVLFEFTDGLRRELARSVLPVPTGQWRELCVEVTGTTVICSVDARPCVIHQLSEPPRGFLGLWTKADSVTDFESLQAQIPGQPPRLFPA